MNIITKKPLQDIGYHFIDPEFIPEGQNEYYLRDIQNRSGINYRNLTAYEIEVLVRNNNTSDNWNQIQVSDAFNPELVKNCKFYGLVRIGKLESISLEYHNVCHPVGLYNSTIISCDFGDNVVVNNVRYMSHYIIGNEVMLLNIHELHVTDHSKFGNGILKEGEHESLRIWVEVCNENAGRKIIPFNGMQPGDAYLWAKHRDDESLMNHFRDFTEQIFDKKRGYYGKIGDRSVLKNTSIIKDVWIGTDAYVKGANKLKNLTINSIPYASTQIGEGCELVNGIIGEGCRIFYGVKAVRFILASHSQLKYGARLINSYLGSNSTISCCEVLNSLIFPAHEQHHNNSFLCAALVMGQSNIAAGATIGSNHNSRAADGEMVTGRGFWPGLCVSLKHNSKFATFTLLAKGDYSSELNIPIPFSLVSNDVSANKLSIMPAYWFMYNFYALARNAEKYVDRDKRTEKIQLIEYDFLAPDSVNEIFDGLDLLRSLTAKALHPGYKVDMPQQEAIAAGEVIINDPDNRFNSIDVLAPGLENSNRVVCISKVKESYTIFRNLVIYYGVDQLLQFINSSGINNLQELKEGLPAAERLPFTNVGGQLIPTDVLRSLMDSIRNGETTSWETIHQFYQSNGEIYSRQKLQHAWASLLEVLQLAPDAFDAKQFNNVLQQALAIKEWMYTKIYESRAKDYQNAFRKMLYDNDEEMNQVIGSIDDNVFINRQKEALASFKNSVKDVMTRFGL